MLVLMSLFCYLMVQTATSAPAPGASGAGADKAASGKSPQLLYMKTLHDRIKGAKVKAGAEGEIKDEETSGTLIASSFEVTGSITGAGENECSSILGQRYDIIAMPLCIEMH